MDTHKETERLMCERALLYYFYLCWPLDNQKLVHVQCVQNKRERQQSVRERTAGAALCGKSASGEKMLRRGEHHIFNSVAWEKLTLLSVVVGISSTTLYCYYYLPTYVNEWNGANKKS